LRHLASWRFIGHWVTTSDIANPWVSISLIWKICVWTKTRCYLLIYWDLSYNRTIILLSSWAPGRPQLSSIIRKGSNIGRMSLQQRNIYRSEEHTSELQSRENLVCRLLLEKK